MILLYDGSFEGYLSLVYEVYYKRLKPLKIYKKLPQEIIFEEIFEIENSKEKYEKVLNALKLKFPKQMLEKILNIFMCDSKDFEIELLDFIILGFKDTKELYNINNPSVFYINNLEKELFRLVHKMYAFIRFEELENHTLYGKIDSKFNVVYFLAKHFLKRFNNQNFIIHDVNRKIAFIKIENNYSIEEIAYFDEPIFSNDEEKFQQLWKSFYKGVTIKERINLKLQQNLVPLIYRTYMSEFLK